LENRLGFFKDPSCFFLSVFTFDFIVIFYFWEPPNTLDGSQAIEIGPHFFFGSKCNLNSGPHACEAHGLLLEPCTQPFFSCFLYRISQFLPEWASDHNPPSNASHVPGLQMDTTTPSLFVEMGSH
jgi:hypothetical protein